MYSKASKDKAEMEPPLTCLKFHAGSDMHHANWKKQNKNKSDHEEGGRENLKLYCTTLCQRSNGLTSQLLANGIMGEQRQEKDRTTASETTLNTKDRHVWVAAAGTGFAVVVTSRQYS